MHKVSVSLRNGSGGAREDYEDMRMLTAIILASLQKLFQIPALMHSSSSQEQSFPLLSSALPSFRVFTLLLVCIGPTQYGPRTFSLEVTPMTHPNR